MSPTSKLAQQLVVADLTSIAIASPNPNTTITMGKKRFHSTGLKRIVSV